MPIYEYFCKTCEVIEALHFGMKEMKEELPCQECGEMMKLWVSTPHFQVHGANYNNGYSGESNFRWLGVGKKKRGP